MTISLKEIRQLLPHRFPLALVDRVLELQVNHSLRAIKCVSANEPCFAGLADNADDDACCYPQTLMIESFLQAAGIFLIASQKADAVAADAPTQPMVLLFGSLSDCAFYGDVQAGDTLEHSVKLERMFAGSAIVSGQSRVGARVVFEVGQAVVVIRPAESLEAGRVGLPSKSS
jgi:3-hydroxyacyl-[acyl-carrier-protein] dehydratase